MQQTRRNREVENEKREKSTIKHLHTHIVTNNTVFETTIIRIVTLTVQDYCNREAACLGWFESDTIFSIENSENSTYTSHTNE